MYFVQKVLALNNLIVCNVPYNTLLKESANGMDLICNDEVIQHWNKVDSVSATSEGKFDIETVRALAAGFEDDHTGTLSTAGSTATGPHSFTS